MTYVIIGNSAAGILAAEAIRNIDKHGDIVIISEENLLPYSRCLIPNYLEGAISPKEMLFRPEGFYQELDIIPFLGYKVIRINDKDKRVILDNGEFITYSKLLIAAGASPRVPLINAYNYSAVYTLRTWEDARDIIYTARRAERAVVVGGGIVGIKAAVALLRRCLKVTVIMGLKQILSGILDQKASELVTKALKNLDLELIFDDEVEAVVPHPSKKKLVGVGLRSGREITCQLVVLDKGVEPNIGLVQGTGIKVNKGIVVNSKMETSVPSVYAAGDVTEARDRIFEDIRYNPNWPNATSQGWAAGHNMAGVSQEHPGTVRINYLELGVPVFSVGLVDPENEDYEIQVNEKSKGTIYRKLVLKDGIIYGALLLGDTKGSGTILSIIKKRSKLNDSTIEEILEGDYCF